MVISGHQTVHFQTFCSLRLKTSDIKKNYKIEAHVYFGKLRLNLKC
jgi:hypothetical protein